MTTWKRVITVGVVLWGLVGGQTLFALTLEEAQDLTSEVYQKRRQAYEEIARRNGTSVSAVETLAGEKAVQNTKPGNFVEGPGGWMKK